MIINASLNNLDGFAFHSHQSTTAMKGDTGADTLDTIICVAVVPRICISVSFLLMLDAQSYQAVKVCGALAETRIRIDSLDLSIIPVQFDPSGPVYVADESENTTLIF
ncbi:hypothetical protein EYZ11_008844 [Aspergillus tanneri]|uniref:Uncharacterized protein n=1 Tax=Aspergillus tanneri TaxID=1220188 RepID=A0A4S3J9F1_9EURO|nr:hypothetical protein EYZ11_008844 [Aspergillus tanneri]